MSEKRPSKVFMFGDNDAEMMGANEKARATFRYFWRELAWERRRIVPALDMACVKAPFSDGEGGGRKANHPQVEHMWLNDIDFDGRYVSGTLLNEPNWIKSVKKGDRVRVPLKEIGDWMYAISGVVYGAYTVNLMRSRMEPRERREHDRAWGLNFGDPETIRIVPAPKKAGGLLKRWFGRQEEVEVGGEIGEHPMSENMGPALREQLGKNPTMVHEKDEKGWTLLHHQALAGSVATVQVLLECGADVNAVTNQGVTAMQLAKSLEWEKVVALLAGRGGKR